MRYPDVKQAVREYMASLDNDATSASVQIALASKFGIDIQPSNWSGYYASEGVTFCRQVSRALDQLADEGGIIKSIRTPVGRKKVAFWTRRDVAEAKRRAKEREAQAAAIERADLECTASRFRQLGYAATVTRTGELAFTRDEAGKMLTRLENTR